jgi:C-terminal processing protease CtpA/Prc
MRHFAFLFVTISVSLCVNAQTSQQQKKIIAFAKLYGYVKYFHPSDEAAALDWDRFAIYGAGKVLQAKSDAELTVTLEKLFHPFAPSVQIGKNPVFKKSLITPADKNYYKPSFWFHTGVGFSDNPIYSSVRLNRPQTTKKDRPSGFAPFTQAIEALALRGKEIKMTGRMKVDVAESGTGHFWLRVDRADNKMGFFYNMDDKPAIKNEWQSYEFTGKVDADAQQIYFGGFLKGDGTVWADDVKLFERDKEGDLWRPVTIKNGGFETAGQGSYAEGWFAGPVEGYKYAINPSDDNKILEITSENSTAQPDPSSVTITTAIDYKASPEPGEVVNAQLGTNIEAIIPTVLYCTTEHTYPTGDTENFAILKKEMNAFFNENRNASSLALRLGDVVITWNIFKHFFPYWNNASQSADAILEKAIARSFTDQTALAFKETLLKMTEPLNDGHIWVGLTGDASNAYTLPVQFDWVEGKVIVDKVLDKNVGDVQPGDIVDQIDGKSAADVYRDKMSLVSGSPQWKSYRAMSNFAAGVQNSSVKITLLRGDKTIELQLNRDLLGGQYGTAVNNLRKKSGKVTDDIYYLDLNTLSKDTIDNWIHDLAKAKGIICDLRGYPNSNQNLINHLLKTGEDTKWMFVAKTAYPNQQKIEFKDYGWNMQPQQPAIAGKVIFITDGRAISYAESYMGFIKDFKLATIIGQPTAGTNGNVNPFTLPGGYTISWTGMLVKNHDGSAHHIKGIVPDIPLQRTIKGVAEGRDEFYEKAVQLIQEQ